MIKEVYLYIITGDLSETYDPTTAHNSAGWTIDQFWHNVAAAEFQISLTLEPMPSFEAMMANLQKDEKEKNILVPEKTENPPTPVITIARGKQDMFTLANALFGDAVPSNHHFWKYVGNGVYAFKLFPKSSRFQPESSVL